MIMDSLASLALATDEPDANIMQRCGNQSLSLSHLSAMCTQALLSVESATARPRGVVLNSSVHCGVKTVENN